MARPVEFTYSYATIAKLTGLTKNTVYQHVRRSNLNPEDLASVLVWAARHGKLSLRKRIVGAALSRELDSPKRRK